MFFVVTMTHPDGEGWGNVSCRMSHVEYLNRLIAAGKLRASGPAIDQPLRTGLLIFEVADRAGLDSLIAADPFAKEGLIVDLAVIPWSPMFGIFAEAPIST